MSAEEVKKSTAAASAEAKETSPSGDASTPATLKVVTEEEYTAGVETVTIDGAVPVARQGVYSLDGQRLGDTPDGLPKGIYIVNGKKVVIK